jgi:hypothetical protein
MAVSNSGLLVGCSVITLVYEFRDLCSTLNELDNLRCLALIVICLVLIGYFCISPEIAY